MMQWWSGFFAGVAVMIIIAVMFRPGCVDGLM